MNFRPIVFVQLPCGWKPPDVKIGIIMEYGQIGHHNVFRGIKLDISCCPYCLRNIDDIIR